MLKKERFGNVFEICYDTVIDHDAYQFLRISLEVPRDNKEVATVVLNGKDVGRIQVVRANPTNRKSRVLGFDAFRLSDGGEVYRGRSPKLGMAVSWVITDVGNSQYQ